tara:strand:- start:3153 stop:3983 length:831 start_codon:yes stop_codon:yes gene_type:complete
MTAVNLKNVLEPASKQGYALAGLVVLGWEDALAYVEAAEETKIPIILQAGPGCRQHTPIPILGKMFRYLADNSSVSIVCHIDHGYTVEECMQGIDSGFTSVMFDGSKLSISENIDLTALVAEKAHASNVSVEGEVGFVGYSKGVNSKGTDPLDAKRFSEESGADALAISVGNTHLQTTKISNINFDLVRSIEEVTNLPLVLHGSSGLPTDTRKKLAKNTMVSKFNIGTEIRMIFGESLRKKIKLDPNIYDRIELLNATIPDVKMITSKIIKEFGPK